MRWLVAHVAILQPCNPHSVIKLPRGTGGSVFFSGFSELLVFSRLRPRVMTVARYAVHASLATSLSHVHPLTGHVQVWSDLGDVSISEPATGI